MALRVFVDTAAVDEVAPVDIDVTYPDGTRETLRLDVTGHIPTDVLGALAPTATSGSVTVSVRALDAPGIACSKPVLLRGRCEHAGHAAMQSLAAVAGPPLVEQAIWAVRRSKRR